MERISWVRSQMFDTEQPVSDDIWLLFLHLISTAFSLFLLVIVLCYTVLYTQFSVFCGWFCVKRVRCWWASSERFLPGEGPSGAFCFQERPSKCCSGVSWKDTLVSFSLLIVGQLAELKIVKNLWHLFFFFFNRTYWWTERVSSYCS